MEENKKEGKKGRPRRKNRDKVKSKGAKVFLTPKEYEMLNEYADNTETPVSEIIHTLLKKAKII